MYATSLVSIPECHKGIYEGNRFCSERSCVRVVGKSILFWAIMCTCGRGIDSVPVSTIFQLELFCRCDIFCISFCWVKFIESCSDFTANIMPIWNVILSRYTNGYFNASINPKAVLSLYVCNDCISYLRFCQARCNAYGIIFFNWFETNAPTQ
jgi:hypothetical protein